jgi:hypothetical protein
LMVLSQSWAVRHWALKRFAKVDDYLMALKTIVLGVVESDTASVRGVITLAGRATGEDATQSRDTLA